MTRLLCCGLAVGVILTGCGLHSSSNLQRIAIAEKSAVAVSVPGKLAIQKIEHPESKRSDFEVVGLSPTILRALRDRLTAPDQWREVFAVYAEPTAASIHDLPALFGQYHLLADRIRFEPQFPLQPGMRYRAELRLENLAAASALERKTLTQLFEIKAAPTIPKTVVQQIYPSAETLPENLLKFYLHFSHSMSRGSIYQHIHLLDAAGKAVELPFLEIDEELWNPAMTRLTLFIDPGRIKRGVKPLEEIGPSLQVGHRYTLVIDREWHDSDGAPLKSNYRKTFNVGPPDRQPPNPASWSIQRGKAGTRQPLQIRFNEPIDHALAQRLIWVADSEQRRVKGTVLLSDQERQWWFTPESDWKSGSYQVFVGEALEDLAGNSPSRPFEVDVFDKVEERSAGKTIALPFDVAPRR